MANARVKNYKKTSGRRVALSLHSIITDEDDKFLDPDFPQPNPPSRIDGDGNAKIAEARASLIRTMITGRNQFAKRVRRLRGQAEKIYMTSDLS